VPLTNRLDDFVEDLIHDVPNPSFERFELLWSCCLSASRTDSFICPLILRNSWRTYLAVSGFSNKVLLPEFQGRFAKTS
jgi:hypothetical protein